MRRDGLGCCVVGGVVEWWWGEWWSGGGGGVWWGEAEGRLTRAFPVKMGVVRLVFFLNETIGESKNLDSLTETMGGIAMRKA